MFGQVKPVIPKKEKKDNCKIKFKNTAKGHEVQFDGNCSREQIEIAKQNNES